MTARTRGQLSDPCGAAGGMLPGAAHGDIP